MTATEAPKEVYTQPSRERRPKRPRSFKRTAAIVAALSLVGAGLADKTSIGRSLEHAAGRAIENEVQKGLKSVGNSIESMVGPEAKKAGKVFNRPAPSPHAIASVDQASEVFKKMNIRIGGKVKGYVGVYAEHGHALGGETYDKLLPYDALIGDNVGNIEEKVQLIYDNKTTTYSDGKKITKKTTHTLQAVEYQVPEPEIISPRILLDSPAMYAKLRPGMTNNKIRQKVSEFEKKVKYAEEHDGADAPAIDDGISMHKTAWCLDQCGDITNTDAEVPQLGLTAAQVAISLDAYNPFDRRVQGLIKNTDNEVRQDITDKYEYNSPHVQIIPEYSPTTTVAATIEQRYLQEAPELGVLAATAYFTTTKEGKTEDLAFVMKLPDGSHAQVTFNDEAMTSHQATELNNELGLVAPTA